MTTEIAGRHVDLALVMAWVLERFPDLTAAGFPRASKRRAAQRVAADQGRESMFEPCTLDAFARAHAWLRYIPNLAAAGVNNSASLKTMIERDLGPLSHGAVIAALVATGIEFKRHGVGARLDLWRELWRLELDGTAARAREIQSREYDVDTWLGAPDLALEMQRCRRLLDAVPDNPDLSSELRRLQRRLAWRLSNLEQ